MSFRLLFYSLCPNRGKSISLEVTGNLCPCSCLSPSRGILFARLALDISFAPYAARGRACSGSS